MKEDDKNRDEVVKTSVTQIIWTELGKPDCQRRTELTDESCTLCGSSCNGVGVASNLAFGKSFSDYRDLAIPASRHICRACVWAMRGKPPNTLRMWSILWRSDGKAPPSRGPVGGQNLYTTNKGDIEHLLAVLRSPPNCAWAMVIADSGQIHTLPFAIVNLPGSRQWQIRYERNDIRMAASEFSHVYEIAELLYKGGYSRRDIFTGAPHPSVVYKRGIDLWREAQNALKSYFNSNPLELACSFLRKELRNG